MSQYPPPQHPSWAGHPGQQPQPGQPGYAPQPGQPGFASQMQQQLQQQYPQQQPQQSGYAYPQQQPQPGYPPQQQGYPQQSGYAHPQAPQGHGHGGGYPQTQPVHQSYAHAPQAPAGYPQTQPVHPSYHGVPGAPPGRPGPAPTINTMPAQPGSTAPVMPTPGAGDSRYGAGSLPPRSPASVAGAGQAGRPGSMAGRSQGAGGAPGAPAQSLAGRTFGPYELEKELGRGGMGIVYKGFHRDLRRPCALKTLLNHGGDKEAMDRFVREGQSSAKLGKHPNIVGVFDAGIIDGTPYIAMEFVTGDALDKRSEAGPLPVKQVLEIGHKVALAVDHAHRCGIIHRDLKPANVIVDEAGEPQVLDFGLAKDTASKAELSQANAVVGTPAYMPPEQAQPGQFPVDKRSDVYSLGATLYALLSGKAPFGGASAVETIVRVVFEDAPRLSSVPGIQVDADLEAIIDKSMEKDPARRYQSALEMADDLSKVMNGEHPKARRVSAFGRLRRRLMRNRGVVALITIVSIIVAAGVGYLLWIIADSARGVLRRNKAVAIVGEMYLNEGADVRIEAFKRVVAADPTWDRGYFQLAVAYLDRALEMDAEDLEKAKGLRLKALETLDHGLEHGLGALGYLQRGNSYEEMQLLEKARADWKNAWEAAPDTTVGLKAGAAYCVSTNDFARGEELASKALVAAPDDDLLLYKRAIARYRLGKLEEAYADATRACELWTTEPEYYLLAAQAQVKQGRHAIYAKHILEARAVNAEHPRLLAELAQEALRRAEPERALRLANEAIRLDDQRPVVEPHDRYAYLYLARARVHLTMGRRDLARADLERAVTEDPLQASAKKQLESLDAPPRTPPADADAATLAEGGWDAFRHGGMDEALAFAEAGIKKDRKNVSAHDLAARALLMRGKAKEAIASLRLADTPELLALRAWVQLRAGLAAAAGEDARAALAGKEQPTMALVARAGGRLASSDEEQALIDVSRALRSDPLDLDALEIKARCLDAIKDQDGAAETRDLIAFLRCEAAKGGTDEGAEDKGKTGARGAVGSHRPAAKGDVVPGEAPEGEEPTGPSTETGTGASASASVGASVGAEASTGASAVEDLGGDLAPREQEPKKGGEGPPETPVPGSGGPPDTPVPGGGG